MDQLGDGCCWWIRDTAQIFAGLAIVFFARASASTSCYVRFMSRSAQLHVFGWIVCIWQMLVVLCSAQPVVTVPQELPCLTNVFQFDCLAEQMRHNAFSLHVEGVVRWIKADGSLIVLQDKSGAALVQTEPQSPPLRVGQNVSIAGEGSVAGSGADVHIGRMVLINDNAANMVPEKAAIFLKAGKCPLCIQWLADNNPDKLEVHLQGPGLSWQKIPDSMLFRREIDTTTGAKRWIHGLNYQIYEGQWPDLPDFCALKPVQTGNTKNFNLAVRLQDKNIALQFSCWIEVPSDGLYTFSLASLGHCRLFIGMPRVQVLGRSELPPSPHFSPGQTISSKIKSTWGEMEGLITFISRKGLSGYDLELTSAKGHARINLADGSGVIPELWLDSHVRVSGICRSACTVVGQRTAGVLWVPGTNQVTLLELSNRRRHLENTYSTSEPLPLLTSVNEVMHLKRDTVPRGFPVKIRAVVVWSGGDTCEICDSTGGIYVDGRGITNQNELPLRAGEYREIEGVTEVRFSPIIVARRAIRLGLGTLPEPLHPTMDELLNGTLDAQYVELEGIVTGVNTNRLTILTRGGKIQVYLIPPMWDGEPSVLTAAANPQEDWSQIHLAGC